MTTFQDKVKALRAHHEELLSRKNEPVEWGNGIYEKYKIPILTAEHTPLEWRYDFDEKSNPYLMQRIMMNATLNSGAISGMASICSWYVWREPTARVSSLWLRVLTVSTTSVSGMSLSLCLRISCLLPISMICA